MAGPKAPRDPEIKRKNFYIMRNKQVEGSPQPDGTGVQTIFLDNGRLGTLAKLAGNVQDEEMLKLMDSAAGFRQLVFSIGVSVESDNMGEPVDFALQMYGKCGTEYHTELLADGMEYMVKLSEIEWSEGDNVPGQMRFGFEKADTLAVVTVRLYLQDGYDAPEQEEEEDVDFGCAEYSAMLDKSMLFKGNNIRFKKVLEKARHGEDVTVAFIGGSITQGAWAIPVNTECYAYKAFEGFCELSGHGTDENIHYIKAGIGGTSSELGMVRYKKDLCVDGKIPDLMIVEYAVNDEGDETKGDSYDSLVRRMLLENNAPAVILLFSVFTNDWNLQDRLKPVGEAYHLPMVSVKDCVVDQFYKKPGQGRVISKSQFFYDIYHPTGKGHKVMADCLIHMFRALDAEGEDPGDVEIGEIKAPYSDEFVNLTFFDRTIGGECRGKYTEGKPGLELSKEKNKETDKEKSREKGKEIEKEIIIDCGDFTKTDSDLQMVERNTNTVRMPEFTNNWMHTKGEKPFVLDIECSALLIVEKDSGSEDFGCAEVFVDGKKVRTIDPHEVGWVHCNALICFRHEEKKIHHVEIRMMQGDEDKKFTILGFAYVG